MTTPTQLLAPKRVAELLACDVDHVYDLLNGGQMAGVRIGERRWAVSVEAYEAFVASRTTAVAS